MDLLPRKINWMILIIAIIAPLLGFFVSSILARIAILENEYQIAGENRVMMNQVIKNQDRIIERQNWILESIVSVQGRGGDSKENQ